MQGVRKLKGNQQLISEINRSAVLRVVRDQGPVSRPQLSTVTGLSPTTATFTVNEMVAQGFLREIRGDARALGRPPVFFELEANARYAVGAQIELGFVRAQLINLRAEVIASATKVCDAKNVAVTLDNLARLISTVLHEIDQDKVLGIGVSSPGQVDSQRGIVIKAMNTGWVDVDLTKELAARGLSLPVLIGNDANLAALAEKLFGVGQDTNDLIFIIIGTGIGAGLIIDGHIHPGATFDAGEIGHLIVAPHGRRCSCGEYGCLEAHVSERAILEIYRERGGASERQIPEIIQEALAGEGIAREILHETGEYLAISVSSLAQIANPNLVILGGTITAASPILMPALERFLASRYRNKVNIHLSKFGEHATIIGAAARFIQHFFDPLT